MGCNESRSVVVKQNKDRFKLYEPRSGLSSWYEACREGDHMKLLVQLPFLTFDQLNRMEENGSTCLHVACYNDHYTIVMILLMCGYDRNIKNKYGLTALQETKSEKVRELFALDRTALQLISRVLYSSLEDEIFTPNNKFIMGHVSIDHVYDAKRMVKAYRKTGLQSFYAIQEINVVSYGALHRVVKRCIPEDDLSYKEAIQYLDSDNPFDLIRLYTLQTKFYTYLQDDNAEFTAIVFINLVKFRNRAYKGRTYRSAKMAHFDVNAWKWGVKKPKHIIETQTFISTSELEEVAKVFASSTPENKVSVLFVFDFPSACDPAIQLTADPSKGINEDVTKFPDEKEVLVMSYTLFKVNSVDLDQNTDWYQIHLTNTPITS